MIPAIHIPRIRSRNIPFKNKQKGKGGFNAGGRSPKGREQTTRNICCFLFTNNPKTTGNAINARRECLEKTACSHVYFSMFKARECEYLLDGRSYKKTGIETKETEKESGNSSDWANTEGGNSW
jgi:hypothetical protein